MINPTTTRITETHNAAMVRLAQKARGAGVRVRIGSDGRFFVSSASRFGHEYFVTAWTCGCTGFAQHGKCMHLAATHAALGWLDLDDDPGDTAA